VEIDGISGEELAEVVGDRPYRFYTAVVSTESAAMAWARAGAPSGSIVVARYQAAPRGRSGLEWRVDPSGDVAFSLILRPDLPERRLGWMYTVAASGLADLVGGEAQIEWPDQVYLGVQRRGAVGVQSGEDGNGRPWAVINLHLTAVPSPREPWIERLVQAVEHRYGSSDHDVLTDYLPRCRTIGRRVVVRLLQTGPTGRTVTGEAVGAVQDGGLVIRTEGQSRVVVLPHSLGALEFPA
jgi:BirA family biotin operon repressor/biotin-[acetyl-CoA-carboxylase] ligase